MTKTVLNTFYGGTFDPIHYGHLQPIIALAKQLYLKQIILIPNNITPHRPQPQASPQQRLEMVRLFVAEIPENLFVIDERELHRDTPSYTWETFRSLRKEYGPAAPLAFIIGQDSLLTLPKWYRGLELLDFCHLLVCSRPGYSYALDIAKDCPWLLPRLTYSSDALYHYPAGFIYCANTPKLAISASIIRKRYQGGLSCDNLIFPSVQEYIYASSLYT